MTELLIGLDVGTTSTKAQAFDLRGKVMASASHGYGLITPHPDWVEQDPEELWGAVVEALRGIVGQLRPADRVLALAQSSQAGTTIPVDGDGRPTYNAFSWMDQRAHAQAAAVREALGPDFIYRTTGWPLIDGLPLQHVRWLQENRPERFAAARHFLFVNDFIGLRLTGELCMNQTDAGITQLFSIAGGDWDDRLLEWAGIRRDQLSRMRPSGYPFGCLTAAAALATGLPPGLPVVNGAHDQYCTAIGAGVMQPGKVLLSCGTAWVLLAVPESREVALRTGMATGRHVLAGRWGAMRSLGAVGTSVEWLLDNVWGGREPGATRAALYDALNQGAARSAPGAGGLLFYPLAGGRGGSFGPARGGVLGLTLSHSRDDLARAVMEGIVCELRWAIEEISAAGVAVSELRMTGGAARSPLWPQIVADVTRVPVGLPATTESASRGAAILAGVGAGVYPNAEAGFAAFQGAGAHLAPDPALEALYDAAFATYKELSQDVITRLARLGRPAS
jgi:xylulokinase